MTINLFGVDFDEEDDDRPQPQPQGWTLADIYADLGTKDDIARTLNVTRTRVRHWIHRLDEIGAPPPVRELSVFKLYSMQAWKDWYEVWKQHLPEGAKRERPPYAPPKKREVFWVPRTIYRD